MKSTGGRWVWRRRRRGVPQGCLHEDGDSEAGGGRRAFSIADHDKREALELAFVLAFDLLRRRDGHGAQAQPPLCRRSQSCALADKLAKLFDSGKIRLIIATPTHGRDPMRAGFRLRRMAVEYGIACVTSIDTAKLLMKCVKLGKKAEDVPPLGLHDLIL